MAGPQTIWGIDVGRCALKAIKLKAAADGKVEVVAHEYIEHAKILSQPDADRHALIAAALEKFLSGNDLSKDGVVVSVPGQNTLARFTKLPPVQPKKIPDIVRYEAEQQIPFDMDEVIWDYHTFQQEGLPDVQVGIFAMKRELIREHLLHFEQVGIEPLGVQSGPLAVYNMAHFDGRLSSETTILLDIGAENTDLIIATPHSLWTRTVAIGGNSFTEALVKSFKLSFAKAESLKRTAETSKYARQVFQAMRPIFADLVQELQRSIGFYATSHSDTKVDKVVCLGNAFQLPGLQKYLQQNLGLEVEKPESFSSAVPSAALGQGAIKEQFLSFAVAYGLALQGLDMTKVTSNLLPTEIAKQVVWRKKRPAFAAAAACVLVAGGLVLFRQSSDARALASSGREGAGNLTLAQALQVVESGPSASLPERAQGAQVVAAVGVLKKEFQALTGKGQTERTETQSLIAQQRNKAVVLNVLDLIHQTAPRPEDALGTARTPKDIQAALASAPPRAQRKQVFINSVDMIFEPDLRTYNWESKIEVAPPINPHEPDKGSPLPGILVKVECTTPNEGGMKFIKDHFLEALRKNSHKAGLGFYVDHVAVADGGKLGAGLGTPRAGTGRGRGAATLPSTAVGAAPVERVDLLTREPTDNDWRFDLQFDVILEDFSTAGQSAEAPKKDDKKPGKPGADKKGP